MPCCLAQHNSSALAGPFHPLSFEFLSSIRLATMDDGTSCFDSGHDHVILDPLPRHDGHRGRVLPVCRVGHALEPDTVLTQHNLQSQRRSSVLVSVANHTGIGHHARFPALWAVDSWSCRSWRQSPESSTLEARPESRRPADDRDSARLPCFEVRMARRGGQRCDAPQEAPPQVSVLTTRTTVRSVCLPTAGPSKLSGRTRTQGP